MATTQTDERNNTTNRKKRKLHVLNDKNSRTQSLKKRKFSSSLQNIFDREKQLKNEIKILKQERDKYKKERDYFINIYKQMLDIIQPSKSQTQSNIQKNENVNTINKDRNNNNIDEFIDEIGIPNDEISITETQSHNNNNKQNNKVTTNTNKDELYVPKLEVFEDKNEIIPTQSPISYYCKQCDRYFKNGHALGGHNAQVHSTIKRSRKHSGEYHCYKCNRYFFCGEQCKHFKSRKKIINKESKYVCKYCSKTFNSFQGLGDHISIHTKVTKRKCISVNKIKNWNDSHFISVNCKFCKKHFNDFEEYCNHLQKEFDDDLTKEWLYCNELNCNSTKRYSKQTFIAHLAIHKYGSPFHCNLNVSDRNKSKCNYSSAQKSNLISHLDGVHKISCRGKQTKKEKA